jgi:hypothetical protein
VPLRTTEGRHGYVLVVNASRNAAAADERRIVRLILLSGASFARWDDFFHNTDWVFLERRYQQCLFSIPMPRFEHHLADLAVAGVFCCEGHVWTHGICLESWVVLFDLAFCLGGDGWDGQTKKAMPTMLQSIVRFMPSTPIVVS